MRGAEAATAACLHVGALHRRKAEAGAEAAALRQGLPDGAPSSTLTSFRRRLVYFMSDSLYKIYRVTSE